MYLEHFKLNKLPFSLTPDTSFFCDLSAYQAALNVLLFSVKSGEGFIKLTAEVGSGKTMLCRMLLNELSEQEYVTAYVPNPDLDSHSLRKTIAAELGLAVDEQADTTALMAALTKHLIDINSQGKHVVLMIDEAQALPDESLEALRLMTNLETESEKLLQIVLFAQPELDEKLTRHEFRQLRQRITFSHYLPRLTRDDLTAYVCHRAVVAGFTKGNLFGKPALDLLFKFSDGVPRVVNIICHKALLAAYGQGATAVGLDAMKRAIADSEHLQVAAKPREKLSLLSQPATRRPWSGALSGLIVAVIAVSGFVFIRHFGLVH
jgi:MSHA biogenesis protein MshM